MDLIEKIIPIVLCSSDYYMTFATVTIQSIIETASSAHQYEIIIIGNSISDRRKRYVQGMVERKENISIRFLSVSDEIANNNFNYREGYSIESFFRVCLPFILTNYDKVIYMDCDVIVNQDVAELYNTDLSGYAVAACNDPDGISNAYHNYLDRGIYMKEVLALDAYEQYFQSGVMVFNLAEIRKGWTLKEIVEASCNPDIVWGDQDVLNYLFKNHVKYLPMNWNTIIDGYNGRVKQVEEWAPKEIYDAYIAAREMPKIVHYAGVQPWKNKNVDMNEYFWPIAKHTPFYNELLTIEQENQKLPKKKKRTINGFPFAVTVIIPVYNTEAYLAETVESIINQTLSFEKFIQIIFVNNATEDNSESICLAYKRQFSNNIEYIKLEENIGSNGARERGLERTRGKYINFLDSDDKWDLNAFEKLFDYFEAHYFEIDIVAARIRRFDAIDGWELHDYKFEDTKIVNIHEHHDFIQQSICSCWIKHSAIKNMSLGYRNCFAEDAIFLTELILKREQYAVLRSAVFYYRKRLTSRIATYSLDKDWYISTVKNGYFVLLEKMLAKYDRLPAYVQFWFLDEFYDRLRQFEKSVLTEEEQNWYRNAISYISGYISDILILQTKRFSVWDKLFLCSLKNGGNFNNRLTIIDNFLFYNNIKVVQINDKYRLYVIVMELHGNTLVMSGKTQIVLPTDDYTVSILSDSGHVIPITLSKNIIESDKRKYFGKTFYEPCYFSVSVPLKFIKGFSFVLEWKGVRWWLDFSFGAFSHLADNPCSYYHSGRYIVQKINKRLVITEATRKKLLRKEASCLQGLWKNKKYKFFLIRFCSFVVCKLAREQIWLITDRPFAGDDNGEYFFTYLNSVPHKGIKPYFIIRKDSPDYKHLKKIGSVVPFMSWRHKLLFIRADALISSSGTAPWVINLLPYLNYAIGDLLHAKRVHLQHGVIKDDISNGINRFDKNISLFITSGIREKESIVNGKYGYNDSVVKLTGLGRHDVLWHIKKQNEAKMLVIAPTWRNYLKESHDKGKDRFEVGDTYSGSTFFKFFNALINDMRIIQIMKKNGIRGELQMHPALAGQAKYYAENDIFTVIEKRTLSFAEEMARDSFVVTDYSSIAFDYAYAKIPVLYTQFDRDEFYAKHTYLQGYFDYENDGFGPVCYDYESTVSEIIWYVDHGFPLDEKYEKRIDSFFVHRDGKCCERIYNEIVSLTQKGSNAI